MLEKELFGIEDYVHVDNVHEVGEKAGTVTEEVLSGLADNQWEMAVLGRGEDVQSDVDLSGGDKSGPISFDLHKVGVEDVSAICGFAVGALPDVLCHKGELGFKHVRDCG